MLSLGYMMKVFGQHEIRSVVITGCNRGIGLGMLRYFADNSAAGTQLFSCSRRSSPALDELGKRNNVHLLTMDITDKESVRSAVAMVTELLDGHGLNLLVNNAAIASWEIFTKIVDVTPEELNDVYNVNVTGTHMVTTSFYPLLKMSAATNSRLPMCAARGLVLNFSSIAASIELAPLFGQVLAYSYSLSKCAVNMMTKMCGDQFKEDGVLCLAVHPGWVKTDMGALAEKELGSCGDVTVSQAVQHVMDIVRRVTESHSGFYLTKDMEKLPF